MSKAHFITAKAKESGWIDGKIDDFRFQAKVYDIGSKFGINSGRVSKLAIWDHQRHNVTNYDRGWDVKPDSAEQKDILQALLKYLEALPTGEL